MMNMSATNPAAAQDRQVGAYPELVRAMELEKVALHLFRPTPYWEELYPDLFTSLVKAAGEPTRLRWINPLYTDSSEPRRDLDELRRTETANCRRLLGIAEQVSPEAPEGYYVDVDGFVASKAFLKHLRVFSAFLAAVSAGDSLTVLEIGGGNGALAEIVLKASPRHRYVGVDLALPLGRPTADSHKRWALASSCRSRTASAANHWRWTSC